MNDWTRGWEQLSFLGSDLRRLVNRQPHRYLTALFSPGFHSVAIYRINRALFLILGRPWRMVSAVLSPVFFLLRPFFPGCDIHHEADIGPGMMILHSSLGVVVTGKAVIGRNVTFTGGNCIGTKGRPLVPGGVTIGDGVIFGANAVALGPVRIGHRAVISAGSVALRDVGDNEVVGGVPAKLLSIR